MEVTRENFAAVVDDFCELVSTCDFFALDEEMTGINLQDEVETPLMSVSERYDIKKRVAERYSIIQVGVCLFHKEDFVSPDGKPSYVARPFNFFLFPSSIEDTSGGSSPQLRSDVVMSSSAIAFLRRHGMDFQRWVYKGVPYCNEPQDMIIRRQFVEADDLRSNGQKMLGNAKDQAWLSDGLKMAEAFSKSSTQNELMVPQTRSRAARDALRAAVEGKFDNLLVALRGRGDKRDAILVRVTPEEKAKKLAADADIRQRSLLDSVGFRRVFLALTECRKPCVGHNSFADILFLLAALDRPLPPTLAEFKERVHSLFPTLYDTKMISQEHSLFPMDRFESTHLGGLYEAYRNDPLVRVKLPLGFQAYHEKTIVKLKGAGSAHEAGYDALMTGCALLNMLAEVKLDIVSAANVVGNKVAIFRSLYALQTNSTSEDVYLPKGPVLIVKHKKGVSTAEIESCVNGVVLDDADETAPTSAVPTPPTAAASTVTTAHGLSYMPVDELRTAVIPMAKELSSARAACLAQQMNRIFKETLFVETWAPPAVGGMEAPEALPKPPAFSANSPRPSTSRPRALLKVFLESAARRL